MKTIKIKNNGFIFALFQTIKTKQKVNCKKFEINNIPEDVKRNKEEIMIYVCVRKAFQDHEFLIFFLN